MCSSLACSPTGSSSVCVFFFPGALGSGNSPMFMPLIRASFFSSYSAAENVPSSFSSSNFVSFSCKSLMFIVGSSAGVSIFFDFFFPTEVGDFLAGTEVFSFSASVFNSSWTGSLTFFSATFSDLATDFISSPSPDALVTEASLSFVTLSGFFMASRFSSFLIRSAFPFSLILFSSLPSKGGEIMETATNGSPPVLRNLCTVFAGTCKIEPGFTIYRVPSRVAIPLPFFT